MRRIGLLLVLVIVASAVIAPFAYYSVAELPIQTESDTFYYGVTYGLPSVEGAKNHRQSPHIHQPVIFDSSDISKNETPLTSLQLRRQQKHAFIVYFFRCLA
jgi:hypothetical protein